MVDLQTDQELIREYALTRSNTAFSALVERHVDLVYGTAIRSTASPQTAQEVTQNVFIALSRKAPWLATQTTIAGWLHKTAILEARAWWRGELRRRSRENTAVEMGTTMKQDDPINPLSDELDAAMLSLPDGDRQALLLRYYEGRSYREIGDLLKTREDTARMRINKAVERLAVIFRRRGHQVAALSAITVVLENTARTAPVGCAAGVAKIVAGLGTTGSVGGLKLALAKWLTAPKIQIAAVCLSVALLPVGVELNKARIAHTRLLSIQSLNENAQKLQADLSAEITRLRLAGAQLDATLADAAQHRAEHAAATANLNKLKQRLPSLLQGASRTWPADVPYVPIPKRVVHSLDLRNRMSLFSSSGELSEPAVELLGITDQERVAVEAALKDYWNGVKEMMVASAVQTNATDTGSGRISKSILIPPLGEPLKHLAQNTSSQLEYVLGGERQKLLFDGWEQGAIQIFWPGNLWKIADEPQTMSAWADPTITNGAPWFGASWSRGTSGTSAKGTYSMHVIPAYMFEVYFKDWAVQQGIDYGRRPFGGIDE